MQIARLLGPARLLPDREREHLVYTDERAGEAGGALLPVPEVPREAAHAVQVRIGREPVRIRGARVSPVRSGRPRELRRRQVLRVRRQGEMN